MAKDWFKRNVGEQDKDYEERTVYTGSPDLENAVRSAKQSAAKQQQQMFSARPAQNVVVYKPKAESDVQMLIDCLRRREQAIVDISGVDAATSQRMLDFLSGAVYALSGRVHNISGRIYLLTPEGVEITIPVSQF